MTVPPSLPPARIGATLYPFRYVPGLNDSDGHPLLGQCDTTATLIELEPDQSLQRLRDTVLHECIHAMATAADLGDENTEEDWAARLTPYLLDFMRRNPSLLEWLLTEQS
jgi:hypothetical protein